MIDANELRIGNKVKDPKGNILTIYGLTNERHENEGIIWYDNELGFYLSLKEIEAIPLSPEIVEQCGFEKVNERKYQRGKFIVYDNRAVKHFTDWRFMITNSNGDDDHLAYLQTLHQLQNLYFALTGEELTIKEFA